jgi:1-acyl-sn-glycerol-3-phosphate acyltransferase
MLYSIIRLIAALILRVFFRIEVKGGEHIPKEGGFILASNHVSYLDPIALAVACHRKLNFMARDDLFYNPVFSLLISAVGAFPVKRNSADSSALKQAILRLKTGRALVIFPEGSRRINSLSGSVQPGIGFLVAKSNAPIIPSLIRGTDLALPKGARFIRPKKITVCFGKKISIERSESHNYLDIANKIMRSIGHLACK